mmetsp:Transcript_96565/g.181595  ORF Transcript_96565/g.181595 Transcript_96565/m.181595 type:complete len:368 (-) Transcript_96565:91-1194(-)
MEERESMIKNEMAQFADQVAEASAEREKRIKDDMAQITDEVANAAASMIEKILQDLGGLTERVQQVEFVQDRNERSVVLKQPEGDRAAAHKHTTSNGAAYTNGSGVPHWMNAPGFPEGDRSRASLDVSKGSGISQSTGQGSLKRLQEPRTPNASLRAQNAHFSENLNQSLYHLTHAVDRMVHQGGRACSVDTNEGYSQPSSATPTLSWSQKDEQVIIAGQRVRVPLDSPRQSYGGRKPESSPHHPRSQTSASVPPMQRSSSPIHPRHSNQATTPRAMSRDDAAHRADSRVDSRVDSRGSHTLPVNMNGSHRVPVNMTGSHTLPVKSPLQAQRLNPTAKHPQKPSEISQLRNASIPVYHPKQTNYTMV